jgi:hypothetical protein
VPFNFTMVTMPLLLRSRLPGIRVPPRIARGVSAFVCCKSVEVGALALAGSLPPIFVTCLALGIQHSDGTVGAGVAASPGASVPGRCVRIEISVLHDGCDRRALGRRGTGVRACCLGCPWGSSRLICWWCNWRPCSRCAFVTRAVVLEPKFSARRRRKQASKEHRHTGLFSYNPKMADSKVA